jgi:hypothetical protein
VVLHDNGSIATAGSAQHSRPRGAAKIGFGAKSDIPEAVA